jgi:hypothetical protein
MPVESDQALLPEEDEAYLCEKGFEYSATEEGGVVNLVIHRFPFPSAYSVREANLLIRLPAAYPSGKPDMFWTRPDVRLASGGVPVKSEARETYIGQTWQRWSRHWQHAWRPGVDGLNTFIASIQRELARGR